MRLVIVAVGLRVPDWAQTAWEDYAKRFPHELRVELKAVKTEPRGSKTLETLYAAERARIEAAIPKGARIVVLDERGTSLNTLALAARLKDWQLGGGDVDTTLDTVALHHHFTLHTVVPAPRTLLKGVRKLAPATTLRLDPDGTVSEQIYWTLDATRPEQPMSEAQWLAATREQLTQSVKRRLLAADVPVGILLSGGLDSSLLVGLLADQVPDLRTFSIGFEDLGAGAEKADEFEYSDLIAQHFHTHHQQFSISNQEVMQRLPEAVAQMTEPMVSHDVIAFYLLAERVSKEVKVVMSGQGADEVFGGYFWYPKMDKATGSPLEKFSQNYFDRDHADHHRVKLRVGDGIGHRGQYAAEEEEPKTTVHQFSPSTMSDETHPIANAPGIVRIHAQTT